MTLFGIPLLVNCRETWRRFSVWAMTAAAAVQTALLAFPLELEHYLPRWLLQFLAIAILAAGILREHNRVRPTSN